MTRLVVAFAICVSFSNMARGEIFGYIDESGVLTLSNVSVRGPIIYHLREYTLNEAPYTTPDASADTGDPYRQHIEHAARLHAIDPALLQAIIAVESDNRLGAVSRKGAVGLMQVLPETGRRYGATDLFNPAQNIDAGARYLRALAAMFNNDLVLMLAAYNAGENAVTRYGNRIPPYAETRRYVARVIDRYRRLRAGS